MVPILHKYSATFHHIQISKSILRIRLVNYFFKVKVETVFPSALVYRVIHYTVYFSKRNTITTLQDSGRCLEVRVTVTYALTLDYITLSGGWRSLDNTELGLGHHLGNVHCGLGVQSDRPRFYP